MFEERIAKGMAILDKEFPGWYLNINVDALDMSRPDFWPGQYPSCGCVLAQVDSMQDREDSSHGSYLHMIHYLEQKGVLGYDDLNWYDAHTMGPVPAAGFTLAMKEWYTDHWAMLTAEWKAAIQARRFHTELPNG